MKIRHWNFAALILGMVSLCAAPFAAYAFESGSTGIDGVFNPTVDTQLQVPPDGIFNFTDVNIPAGVTVTFARNTTNTPVTILASGDVTIADVLDVSGGPGADSGASGDGNIGDDGLPGTSGPGGFDGGFGGDLQTRGGFGLGPGGGKPGQAGDTFPLGGAGGGFGTVGSTAVFGPTDQGGGTYGASTLLPLIGGSGGGGGDADGLGGGGGGGGGGAILIAASGTINVTGAIRANGGDGGDAGGGPHGGGGGGGSGGAIRLVATTISGNGTVQAVGGAAGIAPLSRHGGPGGAGRIRMESDFFLRTAATSPGLTFAAPGDVFVAGFPSLRITSVAGVAAPPEPTGNADITLPSDTPNPVEVKFQTNNVPVGNTVTLEVVPNIGSTTTTISDALSGTDAVATASANVDLPEGPSVLQAQLSFTVTASLGDTLRNFAKGERVERIELAAAPGQGSTTTFISVSGKAYTWPSSAVAMN